MGAVQQAYLDRLDDIREKYCTGRLTRDGAMQELHDWGMDLLTAESELAMLEPHRKEN